ncbi:MAG: hypothetical protein M1826_001873 [Phylliscum demangeonii]|nr:MAG: hypothetical protein M1826_001873 [Phylliscum demangeonii]
MHLSLLSTTLILLASSSSTIGAPMAHPHASPQTNLQRFDSNPLAMTGSLPRAPGLGANGIHFVGDGHHHQYAATRWNPRAQRTKPSVLEATWKGARRSALRTWQGFSHLLGSSHILDGGQADDAAPDHAKVDYIGDHVREASRAEQ